MNDYMVWIWVAALVFFILVEALTSQLVSLWFIAGAAVAFAASLVDASLPVQLILFVFVSIAALFLLRPLVKQKVTSKMVPTNADMAVGRTVVVTQSIENDRAQGRVKLDSQDWAARSYDGEVILPGKKARVLAIDGVKLIVVSSKEE